MSEVFPTHVGVFLSDEVGVCLRARLPHARGGVSRRVYGGATGYAVFPTHVGVFLARRCLVVGI